MDSRHSDVVRARRAKNNDDDVAGSPLRRFGPAGFVY